MKALYKKPIVAYALIACLSVVLLLGQMAQLHIHVQHSEAASVNAVIDHGLVNHTVDVHATSTLYTSNADHHQVDSQDHHNGDIDISAEGFSKISKVLNLFVLLMLVVGLVLYAPLLQKIYKTYISKTFPTTKHYLLNAPLRAPPL